MIRCTKASVPRRGSQLGSFDDVRQLCSRCHADVSRTRATACDRSGRSQRACPVDGVRRPYLTRMQFIQPCGPSPLLFKASDTADPVSR